MDNREENEIKEESEDILKEYNSQSNSDNIHFEHIDWTYGDGSGCCC